MGNCCIKKSSAMVWADDDYDDKNQWVYYSTPNQEEHMGERRSLLGSGNIETRTSSSVSVNGNEVKIKISKKKLEELLGKVEDLHGMTMDQILDRLIDASDGFESDHYHHQRSWKPNLQSIPEVD